MGGLVALDDSCSQMVRDSERTLGESARDLKVLSGRQARGLLPLVWDGQRLCPAVPVLLPRGLSGERGKSPDPPPSRPLHLCRSVGVEGPGRRDTPPSRRAEASWRRAIRESSGRVAEPQATSRRDRVGDPRRSCPRLQGARDRADAWRDRACGRCYPVADGREGASRVLARRQPPPRRSGQEPAGGRGPRGGFGGA